MNTVAQAGPLPVQTAVTDCWNVVGVHGDRSCAQMPAHIHCRNCPTYSAAAAKFLDAELPGDYLAQCTAQVARSKRLADVDKVSAVVFRVGLEWLALPTAILKEIVGPRPIHPVPHRRNGVLLGLANIRGELLPCFSLQRVLDLDPVAEAGPRQAVGGRFLVLLREGHRGVCPVDEVRGIVHFQPQDMAPPPATIARATATCTRSALAWNDTRVALLDEVPLFQSFNRSLA